MLNVTHVTQLIMASGMTNNRWFYPVEVIKTIAKQIERVPVRFLEGAGGHTVTSIVGEGIGGWCVPAKNDPAKRVALMARLALTNQRYQQLYSAFEKPTEQVFVVIDGAGKSHTVDDEKGKPFFLVDSFQLKSLVMTTRPGVMECDPLDVKNAQVAYFGKCQACGSSRVQTMIDGPPTCHDCGMELPKLENWKPNVSEDRM